MRQVLSLLSLVILTITVTVSPYDWTDISQDLVMYPTASMTAADYMARSAYI